MPFASQRSFSFPSIELWNVLFKVFVQKAKDKSELLPSGAPVSPEHIPMRGKHRGMHSLRHTMASVLLEKDTPLPVISDIIGHLDTNSTAVYLKVDMERLAECPLDFEEVIRLG